MNELISAENALTINNKNLVLNLEGMYGGMSAEFANSFIEEQIQSHPYVQNVFLDMEDVGYVSKRTAGNLLYLMKELRHENRNLFLVNVPRKLYNLFLKYGFLDFLNILNVNGNKQIEG